MVWFEKLRLWTVWDYTLHEKEMGQVGKENGILEGWKSHDILGNASAPKESAF